MAAPNPREAIRAFLERFADPEIEWELDPIASVDERIYHGIDGVTEWLEVIRQADTTRRVLSFSLPLA